MLTEEAKTLTTIHRHITLVQDKLFLIANSLWERARNHDLSKLQEDEFAGFVEINRIAREFPYGSDEYKASLKQVNAVSLHYSRNDHHPEYHPNGVDDMSLVQIIEMVCDWKAASITYGQTSFEDSLRIQIDRFKLSDNQVYLIKLIARELGEQ